MAFIPIWSSIFFRQKREKEVKLISKNVTPKQAKKLLTDGNSRFTHDPSTAQHPNLNQARRTELSSGQAPPAVVLACSDSRVPVEILFDQGIGDIFVIRAAGAVPGHDQLGSLEYAIHHLGANLMVILAHTECGAVKSALDASYTPSASHNTYLELLLSRLDPVVESVKNLPRPAQHSQAVVNSAGIIARTVLDKSQTCNHAFHEGHFKIEAAVYNINSGVVDWLPLDLEAGEEEYIFATGALIGIIVGCVAGGAILAAIGFIIYIVCAKKVTAVSNIQDSPPDSPRGEVPERNEKPKNSSSFSSVKIDQDNSHQDDENMAPDADENKKDGTENGT